MMETTFIMIGKTTVPTTWIALIVAFVVAYGVVRMQYGKKIAEILVDAVFYFIIVWKLSVVITDFETVIKSPWSIVYFHGGVIGFYIGLFVAAIRVLYEVRKVEMNRFDRTALFVGFVVIQAMYQVVMVVLNTADVLVQVVTGFGFVFLTLVVSLRRVRRHVSLFQLVLLFMAGHFFIGAFQPAGIFGTSVIATFIAGLFFMYLFRGTEMELEAEEPL